VKPKILILLFGCIIALLAILSTSCDGLYSVNGVVYEWIDAPPDVKGEIYVDVDAPTNRNIIPIADAAVSFDIYVPTKTDNDGAFESGGTCAPFRYMMKVKIEKEGYKTLNGSFQHPSDEGFEHSMTIFLVRK
jgi:hypothetical protein